VAFATPATVPVAPQPVTLSGRGRTNLTVGFSCNCLIQLTTLLTQALKNSAYILVPPLQSTAGDADAVQMERA